LDTERVVYASKHHKEEKMKVISKTIVVEKMWCHRCMTEHDFYYDYPDLVVVHGVVYMPMYTSCCHFYFYTTFSVAEFKAKCEEFGLNSWLDILRDRNNG
jgi:hypothetical protein